MVAIAAIDRVKHFPTRRGALRHARQADARTAKGAPNALQNGTSLLGLPPGMPRHQPQPRRSCRIFKGLHSALCGYRRKIFFEA
jgi:hypothetical protein